MARPIAPALERALADVGPGTIAGIAAVGGADEDVEAHWSPNHLASEPRFLAYSITKIFTAVLVLRQVEAGQLALDDRLARWFPEVDRATDISLRALLNHSAGIPDYGGLAAYHDAVRRSGGAPWDFEAYADHTWRKGLAFEPEAGWGYSNPGYLLLRRILEAAAAADYATLVAREIAAPLGLARTAEVRTPADMKDLAPATSSLVAPDGAPRDIRDAYHPGWVSHGVVGAPASEIARFLAALFAGHLLAPATVKTMQELVPVPGSFPPFRRPSYGLGLMADPESPDGPVFGHNGGGPGSTASVFHAPAHAAGPVTVCAMATSEDERIVTGMVRAVFEALRP